VEQVKAEDMAKLTDKQKRFCKEYVTDFNATRSAIAAGYSDKGARQIGSDTLAKTYIQEEIKRLQQKTNNKLEVSASKDRLC
jgi:phage terminase small subunit